MSATAVAPVRLVSIGKRYSGTKALDDVSVEVAGGTVHALVGANGAGKSTLGKIVGGVIRPDDGQLFIDDRPVRYASPREARIDGIATIAQELSPVPQMSVIENVFLGIEPRRFGLVQRHQMRTQYEKLISQWGFELDGQAKVAALRTADKQKVEIYQDNAKEYRWRLKAANGQTVAASSEGYVARADAEAAFETVKKGAPKAEVSEK